MNTPNEKTTAHGIDELDAIVKQLEHIKAGPVAEVGRIVAVAERITERMEWAGLRDAELSAIVGRLKAECNSFGEEIGNVAANIQVLSTLGVTVALGLAKLDARMDALQAQMGSGKLHG